MLFPLIFHLKPKPLRVGLLLLGVNWAKEHFPNPTQPQVPKGTPEAPQDCKHLSSRLKEPEDSFVYYCAGNVLKNCFLDFFFLCAYIYKWEQVNIHRGTCEWHTHPAVNVCLSRWMSCLLFPRALITGQRRCYVLRQSERQSRTQHRPLSPSLSWQPCQSVQTQTIAWCTDDLWALMELKVLNAHIGPQELDHHLQACNRYPHYRATEREPDTQYYKKSAFPVTAMLNTSPPKRACASCVSVNLHHCTSHSHAV